MASRRLAEVAGNYTARRAASLGHIVTLGGLRSYKDQLAGHTASQADAKKTCEADSVAKKLAGAAKTSHMKKCVADAVGT